MKKILKTTLVLLIALGAVAGLIFGYLEISKERKAEAEREKPIAAKSSVKPGTNGETILTLEGEAQARIALQVELLKPTQLSPELKGYARVLDPGSLLALVAERTKIQISSPEPIQKMVTVEFSNLPLEKGLSLILKDVNHIFMFSQSDSKTEAETLYRVIVLPKEVKGPTSPDTRPPQQQGIVPEQEPGQRQGEQTENTGTGEGQEPDPVVKRYQMQLEKLEQELAQVEEDSPRGKAITEQMIRLEEQMERRIHGSE